MTLYQFLYTSIRPVKVLVLSLHDERPAMNKASIPSQSQVDWNKPDEHLVWAMRAMPCIAGTGAVTHPGILRAWSEHLVNAGAVHVDYLRTLADEDGNIHVSQLPKQTIKFQEAFRGPRHGFNNAARWVEMHAPDPQPMRLQDVKTLTIQEQHVMAHQLMEAGIIPRPEVPEHKAQELNEGH